MTFLQFQKELYYISEGIILKNSQKDLRRCKGFQKVLYSAHLTSIYFQNVESDIEEIVNSMVYQLLKKIIKPFPHLNMNGKFVS